MHADAAMDVAGNSATMAERCQPYVAASPVSSLYNCTAHFVWFAMLETAEAVAYVEDKGWLPGRARGRTAKDVNGESNG